MITEVKTYYCDNIPNDEDLLEALNIAQTNKCIVRLNYDNLGCYNNIKIFDNDNLVSLKRRMPKYNVCI